MTRFLDLALAGKVMYDEIDDFVETWHTKPDGLSIHEYLGLTAIEYAAWVENPDIIPQIISARKFGRPFELELSNAYEERLAARSGGADRLAEMKRWLATRKFRT